MADYGIKKVTIFKDNLPPIGPLKDYHLRYRIVSDDKNRVSHWSPAYSLIVDNPSMVQGAVEMTTKSVNVTWADAPNNSDKEAYDIFVKFDNGQYFYHGSSYSHSYGFLNQATTSVSVIIQIEGINKSLNNSLKIFEGSDTLA